MMASTVTLPQVLGFMAVIDPALHALLTKKAPRKPKPTAACLACYHDTALPEACDFGHPRGRDIRSAGRNRYCGTCGDDDSLGKA